MANSLKFLIIFSLLLTGCKDINKMQDVSLNAPEGMIWVESKSYTKGAKNQDGYAMMREKPSHDVYIDGFFIDATEVTNNQFQKFVNETGYITIAERKIEWNEIKKSLPAGTPKPHDSLLQPGSFIFNKEIKKIVNMTNYFQWWKWQPGANWKSPEGPGSNINGKGSFPVVHVALEDALAYCDWSNRKLPSEAEWESAAQGNYNQAIYTWADADVSKAIQVKDLNNLSAEKVFERLNSSISIS